MTISNIFLNIQLMFKNNIFQLHLNKIEWDI